MWKKSFAIISALLILFSICSCDIKEKDEEKKKPDTTVSFFDALDREVYVDKSVTRVAALTGSFADVWQLAGGEVCATCDDAWEDLELDLPDAVDLGKLNNPDVEALLEANPELVLASATLASNLELRETLENAGITVAYFDVNSFVEYLDMLAICTSITGRTDLYEKNGLAIKEKIDEIKNNFEGGYHPNEQKTYLLLRASGGFIRAKGGRNTVLGAMLSDLGYQNIADSDDTILEELSIESIIDKNPYRIFVVQVGDSKSAMKNSIANMMWENPAWYDLEAVEEDRLYYMDKTLFNLKPNARWSEAYEVLCELLEETEK